MNKSLETKGLIRYLYYSARRLQCHRSEALFGGMYHPPGPQSTTTELDPFAKLDLLACQ